MNQDGLVIFGGRLYSTDMTEHRSPGRPSKLSPDRIERLAEALRIGHTRATAAALAGVGESTLYAWLNAANQPDAAPEFLDFLEAVKKAEVEAENSLVSLIRNSAEKSWQAGAWLLERRYPDRWAKRVKNEVFTIPSPVADESDIKRSIAETTESARRTRETTLWARQGIPFEEWPPHVKEWSLGIN